MNVVIVSGGYVPVDLLKDQVRILGDALIISADSGADSLFMANISPDVMVGDFDSVNKEVFQHFLDQGIKTIRFSPEKDLTDTHIAIEYAISLGATELVLLGATGPRLDHTFSNLFMLEKYIKKIHCKIIDTNNSIELMHNSQTKTFIKGSYPYISLIPISREASGVTTTNMKYPLKRATLKRNASFGISNEILGKEGSISLEKGLLAVIQSKD